MTTRKLTIEHGGSTYYGQLAKIDSTSLGYGDHGILSAHLHCSWKGGGVSVGGYCLDQSRNRTARDYSRQGTAYGLDHIIRLMETVGVESWEALSGQQVIVLFDGENALGSMSVGIAGVLNDHVLILAEHAGEWKDRS